MIQAIKFLQQNSKHDVTHNVTVVTFTYQQRVCVKIMTACNGIAPVGTIVSSWRAFPKNWSNNLECSLSGRISDVCVELHLEVPVYYRKWSIVLNMCLFCHSNTSSWSVADRQYDAKNRLAHCSVAGLLCCDVVLAGCVRSIGTSKLFDTLVLFNAHDEGIPWR